MIAIQKLCQTGSQDFKSRLPVPSYIRILYKWGSIGFSPVNHTQYDMGKLRISGIGMKLKTLLLQFLSCCNIAEIVLF